MHSGGLKPAGAAKLGTGVSREAVLIRRSGGGELLARLCGSAPRPLTRHG